MCSDDSSGARGVLSPAAQRGEHTRSPRILPALDGRRVNHLLEDALAGHLGRSAPRTLCFSPPMARELSTAAKIGTRRFPVEVRESLRCVAEDDRGPTAEPDGHREEIEPETGPAGREGGVGRE